MKKVIIVTYLTNLLLLKSSLAQFTYCNDSEQYALDCPIWARYGECTKTSEFMEHFCKKSCNLCPSKFFSEDPKVAQGLEFYTKIHCL